MEKLFLEVFNLSITACWLIAAVLLVRIVIRKRAPKWITCLLWAMVGNDMGTQRKRKNSE